MKKSLKAILLGAAISTLLCVSAMAAYTPATTEGFHSLGTANGVAIEVQKADETPATKAEANVDGKDVDDFYANGVRMKVTYTGTLKAGDQYLVMLVEGNALPTKEDAICYIDQKASVSDEASGTIVFDVFPKLPTASKDLTLYITSNAAGFEQIAIPVSYAGQPYKLGDVDQNKAVNAVDALWTLQKAAGSRELTELQQLLANVDKNSAINAVDALWILQAAAGSRELG